MNFINLLHRHTDENYVLYWIHLFRQNFLLFYSPKLCDSIAHIFVPISAVFIELYTIYYASTSENSSLKGNADPTGVCISF